MELDVLYWASWADSIEYIGLTPHMGKQCGTIPIYSNNLASFNSCFSSISIFFFLLGICFLSFYFMTGP